MNEYLKKFTEFCVVRLYVFFSYIKETPRVFLNKWFNPFTVTGRAVHLDPKGTLLFSTFTVNGQLDNDVIDSLQFFTNEGYRIILITSGTHPKLPENLLNLEIIKRPNIGRDFGAYKAGLKYIRKDLKGSVGDWVILLNDSVYMNELSRSFIKAKLDTSNADVVVSHRNRDTVFHYGAFFIGMKFNIIKSRRFENFWRTYVPYSNRKHAISSGEHRLTRQVLAFHKVEVMFDQNFFGECATKCLRLFSPNNYTVAQYAMPLPVRDSFRGDLIAEMTFGQVIRPDVESFQEIHLDILEHVISRGPFYGPSEFNNIEYEFTAKLLRFVSKSSQIHASGIFCLIAGEPSLIKKDIFFRNFYEESDLVILLSALRKMEAPRQTLIEVSKLIEVLSNKRSLSSLTFFEGLLHQRGLL